MTLARTFLIALLVAGCSKTEAPAPETTRPAASAAAAAKVDTAATDAPKLKEGDAAPAIDLTLHDGRTLSLASLKGKDVVVYFYPKDKTPGCTVEAQGVRDQWAEFQKAGVEVIGVSGQDAASHQAFVADEKLPFPLAVDTDGRVAQAFGVPMRNGIAARQTFLIGKDGRIKKIWRQVTPQNHAAEILTAARS